MERVREDRASPASSAESRHNPLLSVVVPAYNVERYLADCLDSILSQSYEPLEIVIVDDGSTDATASIARGYADRYDNVRVVPTPNRGLGAARNLGVAESAGTLLAFVDSDDTLPPGAYEALVGALQRSGSDFAAGSMQRMDQRGYDQPGWMRRLHKRRRLGISIDDLPEILGNVFAWNKVFRRAFWQRHGMAFPEGIRYEDQVTLTRAYLVADGFDVVPEIVYNWRIRDDGSAITDGRSDFDDLLDRIRTKRSALQTVRALGSAEVQSVFRERVLPGDLHRYFAQIPGCTDEYWDLLRSAVREFWRDRAFTRSRLTAPNRLTCWLVAQDRRADAEAIVAYTADYGGRPPTMIANDDAIVVLPYWDDPEANIPLELYRLQPEELGWQLRIDAVRIDGQTLILEGSATLARLDIGDAMVEIVLTAGDGTTMASTRGSARGFQVSFDLAALVSSWPPDVRDAPRIWRATARWESPALRYEGDVTHAAAGADTSATIGSADIDIAYADPGLSITARPTAITALERTPA